MRPTTGGNCFMYRNTGTNSTPVWVLVAEIEDLSIPELARSLAEIKMRLSQFASNLAAIIQTIKVKFKLWYGLNAANNFTALQTMFFSGITEQFAIMDAPITVQGAQGLLCPFLVEEFPIDEGIENPVSIDVGLATAYWESPPGTRIDPSWLTVVAGTSTTTTTLP